MSASLPPALPGRKSEFAGVLGAAGAWRVKLAALGVEGAVSGLALGGEGMGAPPAGSLPAALPGGLSTCAGSCRRLAASARSS
ncbi:hypothetical protein PR002_g31475 [Phytophthora rubi]|uniref:Uncharacterized protein n=1 Tax=Phytophthora rubi TaxID=129364 RepID=A0A6A3GHQ6_9STRA|nr:hypothetical protein PR002_g31475 [Phytophthora rubi]